MAKNLMDKLKTIMTEQRLVQLAISIMAIIALVSHRNKTFVFDKWTIVLLGIAIVPWLTSLIKVIEVPGVGKVEFDNVKNKVTQVKGELDEIYVFLFKCLINEKEVEILKGLESKKPYKIDRVDGSMSNHLYQLRDSELIALNSVKDLRDETDFDLHDKAEITKNGKLYLKYLEKINQKA